MSEKFTVGIIGAGLGGLSLALALKKRGFHDFVIYERDDNVGGTWYNNGYPGCRCDVKAVWYSHSQHPNPKWTETYPPRSEIWAYWRKIAEDNDLLRYIKFGQTYLDGTWDPSSSTYKVNFETQGKKYGVNHNILVSSVGGFSKPILPEINGIKEFEGRVIHSARWPVDVTLPSLRGKTVGVVGNGCTGTQIVAALAAEKDIKVVAIARSPQWLMPTKGDAMYTTYAEWQRTLFTFLPFIFTIYRIFEMLKMELGFMIFPIGSWIRDSVQKSVAAYMRSKAPEHIKDKIVPSYPLGGKRIIRDGGYLRSLNQSNVTAVWDNIASLKGKTITTTQGGKYEVDVLAFATGFDVTGCYLSVKGRDGRETNVYAKAGKNTYHGIAIPYFPNYFMVLGPNTAPTHASVIFNIEVQTEYIAQCVLAMVQQNIKVLEVKEEATAKYMTWLDDKLDHSVWSKTKSWYREGDGTGRCFTNWPGMVSQYWWQNRSVKWSDWVGGEKASG